jgi:deoxyribodipyrimidine photo-lyase
MKDPHRYRRVLVWMRRALRADDNAPLWHAAQDAAEVIPVVSLQPDVAGDGANLRRRFLKSAMMDLDARLCAMGSGLLVAEGHADESIPAAALRAGAEAVYAAAVYDPHGIERDRTIAKRLREAGCAFETFQDSVLFEKDTVLTAAGTPYRVFTPYKRAWLSAAENAPRPFPPLRRLPPLPDSLPLPALRTFPGFEETGEGGGATAARARLVGFMKEGIGRYHETRDLPAVEGTSRLSADLANGTISIRTVYAAARKRLDNTGKGERGGADTFISELIWREFYYAIMAHFPRVVQGAFREEFDRIAWSKNRGHFTAWCEGRTGYPIVDAAMRQLNAEGWMHNRARMIVASFLTKDLHISWQRGERYFLGRLIDADIASNNGGWQWTAGTGTDASPYFRIFNPATQGIRFDPEGGYIRRYVPELASLPPRYIHAPWTMSAAEQVSRGIRIGREYPAPLVDHAAERDVTLALYRAPSAPHRGKG